MAVVHSDGTGLIWWILHGNWEGYLLWTVAYVGLGGTCRLARSGIGAYS